MLIGVVALAGCVPTCPETCKKVLDCGVETERVAEDECITACEVQQILYEQWEDEQKMEAFDDHKRCLMQSTCDEVAEGVCYDPVVFIYE